MLVLFRIDEVVVDMKVVDAAPAAAEVTVAEIPPEKLGVRGGLEVDRIAPRTQHRRADLPPLPSTSLIFAAPATDGLDGHPMDARVLSVRCALVRGTQGALDDRPVPDMSHVLRVVATTDNRYRVWDSNPQALSGSGV